MDPIGESRMLVIRQYSVSALIWQRAHLSFYYENALDLGLKQGTKPIPYQIGNPLADASLNVVNWIKGVEIRCQLVRCHRFNIQLYLGRVMKFTGFTMANRRDSIQL